jgi:hypothetical protein
MTPIEALNWISTVNAMDYEYQQYARAALAEHEAQQQEPFAHICVITTDAGPTKFFTAPSDPRGFPVYTHPPQDAKDAARYRWLRDSPHGNDVADLFRSEWDAVIDNNLKESTP